MEELKNKFLDLKKGNNNNLYYEPVVHILFWAMYFFYPYLQFGDFYNFSFDFSKNFISLFFNIIVVYGVYLILLPKFMLTSDRNKLLYIIATLITLLFIAWLSCKIGHSITNCNCNSKICIFNNYIRYLSLIGIFSAFYLFKKYQQNAKLIETTKKEKHLSELEVLKAQINPHFMLNTLNAIYSYATVKKISPVVSNLIYQFADNLKYVVYEGQQKVVNLGREVAHIENFIELQKFRLENKVDVSLNKDISNKNIMLPPLLLINFVENAFKHTNDLKGKNHKIQISIKEDNGILNFECINPYIEKAQNKSNNEGIGLKNALKRLELEFTDKHTINITTNDNLFKVLLTISL